MGKKGTKYALTALAALCGVATVAGLDQAGSGMPDHANRLRNGQGYDGGVHGYSGKDTDNRGSNLKGRQGKDSKDSAKRESKSSDNWVSKGADGGKDSKDLGNWESKDGYGTDSYGPIT